MDLRWAEEIAITSAAGGAIAFAGEKLNVFNQTRPIAGFRGPAASAAVCAGAVFLGELAHQLSEGYLSQVESGGSDILSRGTGAVVGPGMVGLAKMGLDGFNGQVADLQDAAKSAGQGVVISVGARYVAQTLIGPFVRLPQ